MTKKAATVNQRMCATMTEASNVISAVKKVVTALAEVEYPCAMDKSLSSSFALLLCILIAVTGKRPVPGEKEKAARMPIPTEITRVAATWQQEAQANDLVMGCMMVVQHNVVIVSLWQQGQQ